MANTEKRRLPNGYMGKILKVDLTSFTVPNRALGFPSGADSLVPFRVCCSASYRKGGVFQFPVIQDGVVCRLLMLKVSEKDFIN